MRARHKKWAAPFLEEHPELVLTSIEEDDHFWSAPLFLEIGAGKGDFSLGLSSKYIDHHILALERDTSISGLFAKKAIAAETKNLRIAPVDFDFIFEEIKDLRFEKIFLNFSDPWPKKKHWKRRLTTMGRLSQMASLLKEGGEIRFKSDNDSLYAFTKEEAIKANLVIQKDEPNYVFDENDDFLSEYEKGFRAEGKPIHRLILVVAKKVVE